jgi:hypothetical protein
MMFQPQELLSSSQVEQQMRPGERGKMTITSFGSLFADLALAAFLAAAFSCETAFA